MGVCLKQIKWLFCGVIICLYLLPIAHAATAKTIHSFNLRDISHSDIIDQVSYYSLNTTQGGQFFQLENVFLLLSLGICIALAMVSLFIFMITCSKKYFNYAFATMAFLIGWSSVFGIPEIVSLGSSEILLMPSFIMGAFFTAYFTMQFLRLETLDPVSAQVLKIIAWVCVLSLPPAIYSQVLGLYLASLLTFIVCVVGVYSGIRCWINGHSPAKYFVFALIALVLPYMLSNLINLDVIPSINLDVYLLGLIGNSVGSLLFAFALVAQVRLSTLNNIKLSTTREKTIEERTSEIRQAHFSLEEMNLELIEANNAKGRFLASMSHEIRTPLTSIIGYSDGILLGDIDKADQQRVLKIISENGNHLLEVINDILDINKIEANKLEFESIPTALFAVLAHIESIVEKRAGDKGLAFHLEYQYPLPSQVYTDPSRLKQILFNLTNNALKFTEQGYIGISVAFKENRLEIAIKDSGEGISQQQIEWLVTPFSQADSVINRRFGGIGLGLSISQRLAAGMNGEVTVTSTPRQGSVFTLDIPVTIVEDTPWVNNVNQIWQTTPLASIKSVTLPNFTGSRVLVAEDHANSRELICILLKRMNIEVTEVENGKQALETIFYQKFDLILLDIHMPIMDGSEAIKQIRAAGNSTPVIALTANDIKYEIEHYKRLGFSDHLSKPIQRQQFINTLSLYLTKLGKLDGPLLQDDMLPLIRDYQQDLKSQIAKVQQALEQRDLSLIAEYAHKIRGSAGTFGFDIVGEKFANIEHCALQDDEIAVTYELPKVLALATQCIDLPGVDIPRGITNHHNSVEQLLTSLYWLTEDTEQTIDSLNKTIFNRDYTNAQTHLNKLVAKANVCALVYSEQAFKTLRTLLSERSEEQDDYSKQLGIIQSHIDNLRDVLQPKLIDQI